MYAIPTFRETSVREAILTAAAHRDYQAGGSVFIRQYARRIEIVSPGGFAGGVSADNILDRQFPRNRRIAETFLRCGLVERSGQGVNRMLIEAVTDSKSLPDYSRSDDYEVSLHMRGEVQDDTFVKFLARLTPGEKAALLSQHYLVLDLIRRRERVPRSHREELTFLRSLDLVQSKGRGRGVQHSIHKSLYAPFAYAVNPADPQDRERLKNYLFIHIKEMGPKGCTLETLHSGLPELSRDQVRTLLKDMQADGLIRVAGRTKGARWLTIDADPGEPAKT